MPLHHSHLTLACCSMGSSALSSVCGLLSKQPSSLSCLSVPFHFRSALNGQAGPLSAQVVHPSAESGLSPDEHHRSVEEWFRTMNAKSLGWPELSGYSQSFLAEYLA